MINVIKLNWILSYRCYRIIHLEIYYIIPAQIKAHLFCFKKKYEQNYQWRTKIFISGALNQWRMWVVRH